MDEKSKKIEVINGDGKNLEISEVSTHLSELKPKNNNEQKQAIVIPKSGKKNCNKTKQAQK